MKMFLNINAANLIKNAFSQIIFCLGGWRFEKNPVHRDKSLDVRGYGTTVFQTAGVYFAKLLYRKLRHIKHSVALTNDGGGVAVPFFDPVFLNDEGTQ